MASSKFKLAFTLTVIIMALIVAASGGGLIRPGWYRDTEDIKRTWFGNDLVSLVVILPMLGIAVLHSTRGSSRAQLVWAGLLAYVIYNYAFYLFGAAFNRFFLIYVALFTLSIYALILLLSAVRVDEIRQKSGTKTPVKLISAFLIFMSIPLLVVEGGQCVAYIIHGKMPQVPTLIFALDLSFVVPNMILSAVLLVKRRSWGFVFSVIMLVKGVTYGLVLIVATASVAGFSSSGRWDPLLPFYVVVFAGSLVCCMILLRHLQPGSGINAADLQINV